jgi:hypothetical protein
LDKKKQAKEIFVVQHSSINVNHRKKYEQIRQKNKPKRNTIHGYGVNDVKKRNAS